MRSHPVASAARAPKPTTQLSLINILGAGRTRFFIQAAPREAWHVESLDDCEMMECGYYISVDNEQAKIQQRWGFRKCPDCWIILEGTKHSDESAQ